MQNKKPFNPSRNQVDVILAGIDAAVNKSSNVCAVNIKNDVICFAAFFTYPEQRARAIQKIQCALKSIGKLDTKQRTAPFPRIDFQISLKTPLTNDEINTLTAAFKKTYPNTVF